MITLMTFLAQAHTVQDIPIAYFNHQRLAAIIFSTTSLMGIKNWKRVQYLIVILFGTHFQMVNNKKKRVQSLL